MSRNTGPMRPAKLGGEPGAPAQLLTAMPAPESGDKLTRFGPVQLAMPRRNVKIRQGSWDEEHWGQPSGLRQGGESQQGAKTSRSRQRTNWARRSMEWQDEQERKR
jgi:hypothetical protein